MDWQLVYMDAVDSTSEEVKRRAASGAAEGLAVLAGTQTHGRGRRGNSFQSISGKGLYLSVLLRPALPPAELMTITPRLALCAARGIEACCGVSPGIKWINDLTLNGRKLCGILAEFTGAALVLGIGVNLTQTSADFGPALSPLATSLLQETGFAPERTELARHILRALGELYAQFPLGAERDLAEYRRRCVTLGRQVLLLRGDVRQAAFAEDLGDDFSLLVRYPDGRRGAVRDGEVSVRGLMGYCPEPPAVLY